VAQLIQWQSLQADAGVTCTFESRSFGATRCERVAAGVVRAATSHFPDIPVGVVRVIVSFRPGVRYRVPRQARPITGHRNRLPLPICTANAQNAVNPIDSYDSVMYELPETAVADLLRLGYGVNEADSCGQFLLTVACSRLQLQNVLRLLSSGAHTEVRNPDGNTPLLCAIDVSQHDPGAACDLVKALIDAGADIEARGWMDKTPFLKACSRGCLDILKLLVSRGCNIHAEARDRVNTSGLGFASISHQRVVSAICTESVSVVRNCGMTDSRTHALRVVSRSSVEAIGESAFRFAFGAARLGIG